MQRATEICRYEIGDVDQRRNRLLADGVQPIAHPFWRSTVHHAGYGLSKKRRTSILIDYRDLGCGTYAIYWSSRVHPVHIMQGAQRSQSRCCQVTRYAANPHAVLTVGCDADIDNRIIKSRPVSIDPAYRRVIGKFDNAIMVIAKFKFCNRTHHAIGFDPPDCSDLKDHSVGRDNRAGRPKNAQHAGTRIGSATNDL